MYSRGIRQPELSERLAGPKEFENRKSTEHVGLRQDRAGTQGQSTFRNIWLGEVDPVEKQNKKQLIGTLGIKKRAQLSTNADVKLEFQKRPKGAI